MSESAIKYHDFENAKNEIKKFSEQTTTDLDLKKVDTSKGVGEWIGNFFLGGGIDLDHKVTGEELNELTSQIQLHLHSINNTQIKLIQEFGQVYSALNALDKDYIQAIWEAIDATKATSQSIKEKQDQINKLGENQKKTLVELMKFKQKLDSYTHLEEIDKIWGDCQKWYKEINTLSKAIDNATENSKESAKKADTVKTAMTVAEKRIDDLSTQVNWQIERLESIITFTGALEKISHLQDIDEMWESLSSTHNSLQNIGSEFVLFKSSVNKHQEDIGTLFTFMEKLSNLRHLSDVDAIWTRTEEHQNRLSELRNTSEVHLAKLHELTQKDESIVELVDVNKESINKLSKYKEKLSSITHLDDVDDMWGSVENHSAQLSELEKQSGEIKNIIQTNKNETTATIASAIEQSNMAVEILTKKFKYAYLLAGGAVGLAVVELIVVLMKVI